MKALVESVEEFPLLNGHYDQDTQTFNQYKSIHIGIATQTSHGLLVPVVTHVEKRTLWDCAYEIKRLSEAARAHTLKREELTGSTITLSSLGSLGGIVSTPIINPPEVAIIGVNKIVTQPIFREDNFVPRKIMNLSSSFDHRVIDGAVAAAFIQCIKDQLEHPHHQSP